MILREKSNTNKRTKFERKTVLFEYKRKKYNTVDWELREQKKDNSIQIQIRINKIS